MNILERLWFRFKHGGTNIKVANNGKPVDVVTIQYKGIYLFIDIDDETQEPTGEFGWSHDPTLNPTKSLREIWVAKEPSHD